MTIPRHLAFASVLVSSTLAIPVLVQASPTFEPVALTLETAPNTNEPFLNFEPPAINNRGETMFGGFFGPRSFDFEAGFFTVDGSGSGNLVVSTGDTAPETAGATFFGFSYPSSFNDKGELAFTGNFGSDGEGVFKTSGSDLELLARNNDSGLSGGFDFSEFSAPVINNDGTTAFRGDRKSSNDFGIFKATNTELQQVAREGDAAPGISGFEHLILGDPRLNDSGDLAFSSLIAKPGETINEAIATIFRETDGNVDLFVREGDEAPGTSDGTFGQLGAPVVNNSDGIAFGAFFEEPGASSGKRGIFADIGNGLGLVARTGDVAPGADGIEFNFFGRYALNDEGDIAFSSTLSGSGVTRDNDLGLFFKPADGPLELVLREGDLLEIAAGDNREVTDFNLVSNGAFLNNSDQIAFEAEYAVDVGGSRSGIFTASIEPTPTRIPVPSSFGLLCGGLALLGWFTRRVHGVKGRPPSNTKYSAP